MASLADAGRSRWTRAGAAVAIASAAMGLAWTLAAPLAAQKPTFSTKTEAVYVAATVIDKDGRLVTGLTKDDFEIRENGAPREITVFRSDTVPFAIVIMLDVSGSMFGNLGLMRRGVDQLVSRFEPGDRASIGTFQALPMINPRFTANPQRLLDSVSAAMGGMGTPCLGQWNPEGVRGTGGGSAVWAAVQCGIEHVASDGETPRRVVMVVTDAEDNASKVGPSDLRKLADRYGIMIYGIGMFGSEGLNSVTLRELTEQTGGGYFNLKDFDEVGPAFARIAEELRQQYIFGFTPVSTDAGKLDVKVGALRPDTITRWRRVYLQAAPVFTGSSAPATSVEPGTHTPGATPGPTRDTIKGGAAILDALDRYEHAEWRDIFTEASGVSGRIQLDELIRTAPSWIRGGGVEHEPRRRLAVATYLLEVLEQHARGTVPWQERQPAVVALEWACNLLRQGPPLPSEVAWHAASIGLLERAGVAAALVNHLQHVEARFPGQTRSELARAVGAELGIWPYLHDDREQRVKPEAATQLRTLFTLAAAAESSRTEAHLRWGYVELRLGNVGDALEHFEHVGNPTDVYLLYWLSLFKGRALEQAGRIKDAIASYELAMSAVPYAQSAAFSLAAALTQDRRPSEAAALMIRALAITPPVQDPWLAYNNPEMRFWPPLIAQLRKSIVLR